MLKERGDIIRSVINRIGRNHWLVILETSVLVSTALYSIMVGLSARVAESILPYFLICSAIPNNLILCCYLRLNHDDEEEFPL